MKQAERLARNTVANYMGRFVSFLVALFLTPFVINSLGDTGYGIWALLASVTGYLALLDFGLANGLAKYTAGYAARRDQETVSQMASTLFFVFAGVGLVAFAAIIWLSFHFVEFFDVPGGDAQAAQVALVVLGLNFALGLPLSVYNALMVGYQRYDLLNVAISLGWLLNAVLTVLALVLGWDLVGLAAAACLVTLIKAIALRSSLRRWVNPVQIRPSLVKGPLLHMLISYSAFMFVMLACRQIEESTGPVIVGRMVGLDEVTTYSVGVKLSTLLRQFAFPVTVALFPAFSELDALSDQRGLRTLLMQGLRVSALVGLPVAGMAIVLVRPLISLWVGPQHLGAAGIGVIMLLKVLVDQQLLAASSLLQGIGRLKLYMVLHIVAVAVSLGIGMLLAPRWGAIAVAVGSLLAWGLVLVMTIPQAAHLAGLGLGLLVRKALLRPLLATVITCVVLFGLSSWHSPATLLQLALHLLLAGLLYLLLVWWLCLDGGEKRTLVRHARGLLLRTGLVSAAGEAPLEDLR